MAVWWNCQHRSSECAWYFEHDPQRHKVTCYESAWDAGRSAMWMALQYMERGNWKQRPLNSPLKRVCGARFVGLVVANFDGNQFRWNFCHYLAYFSSLHIDLVHNTSGCQIYSQWTATEFRGKIHQDFWWSEVIQWCLHRGGLHTISWAVHTAIGGRKPMETMQSNLWYTILLRLEPGGWRYPVCTDLSLSMSSKKNAVTAVAMDMAMDNRQMNLTSSPYFQMIQMALETTMDVHSGYPLLVAEVLAQRVSSKEGPLEGAFVRSVRAVADPSAESSKTQTMCRSFELSLLLHAHKIPIESRRIPGCMLQPWGVGGHCERTSLCTSRGCTPPGCAGPRVCSGQSLYHINV